MYNLHEAIPSKRCTRLTDKFQNRGGVTDGKEDGCGAYRDAVHVFCHGGIHGFVEKGKVPTPEIDVLANDRVMPIWRETSVSAGWIAAGEGESEG